MKITYDAEANAVYMKLNDAEVAETIENEAGVIIDFDSDGRVVGLEILDARQFFAPKAIENFAKAA